MAHLLRLRMTGLTDCASSASASIWNYSGCKMSFRTAERAIEDLALSKDVMDVNKRPAGAGTYKSKHCQLNEGVDAAEIDAGQSHL